MPPPLPKPLLFASSSTNHHYLMISFVGFLIILMLLFPTLADAGCNPGDEHSLLSFATNFPNLNWSATVDCCLWDGISCDDKRYRVVGLSISKRGLRGTIHSSLQNLTSLSFLNLSYNFLSGPLPDRLFSSFNNLHTIDLSYNRLSGNLPNIFPATLQSLNLSSNHFSGTIQKDILQSMTALNLSNNSFTGSIPPSICATSPALVLLDFSLNDLTGNIPQGFGACSKLQFFSLGFNSLTGHIPTDISGALSLQQLLLPGNSLVGEISENITSLTNLRSLVLFGNMLSGSIPRSIGMLSLLEKLELHINRLTGTLPLSLMNCTKLQLLNLRVNYLGERLSDFDFSSFSQLTILDLGENRFSGVLPKSLFSCKSLIAIRLATNKLEGEISPDILELPSLSFLSLSNNTFKNISRALNILSNHKKLTTLILAKNFFNEPLPAAGISGFQNLVSLGLGGCKLFGQFPTWLMSLTNLEIIDLSQNNINGTIPVWIQNLSNLFYLDLSNNSLSGSFPVELTRLPALASHHVLDQVNNKNFELPVFAGSQNAAYLQYNYLAAIHPSLYLASNNLSGDIPVEIGNMKSIHILDLSQNYFSGTIPVSISNLTNLEILDLSHNLLSGEIPWSLRLEGMKKEKGGTAHPAVGGRLCRKPGQGGGVGVRRRAKPAPIPSSLKSLHFLSSFSVANNSLTGSIPTGRQFDTFSNQSYEGNPGLCGPPMQKSCSEQLDHPSSSSPSGHKRGLTTEMTGGPILGFCFGFGIILTCQTFCILAKRRILPGWIHRYFIWA
ncbi:putative leucine-rich repeat-containing, plant-type, leucine-rich repeat domain superfamily [Helianthus debilis subsp. tardiflorus]